MLIQAIDVPLNNIPVFRISSDHGFLPADDPLRELPGQFTAWEEVADALPKLIIAGRLQRAIDYPLSMRCAMMLLSHLGNGYVWGEPQAASVIPKYIAVPSFHVATQLGDRRYCPTPPIRSTIGGASTVNNRSRSTMYGSCRIFWPARMRIGSSLSMLI